MVGQETTDVSRVLNDRRLQVILEKALGKTWTAESCTIRAAANGLKGFLGDHFRATLTARDSNNGRTETLHLFVKCLPLNNKEKADFIDTHNFNRREMVMFKLFEELGGDDGPNAWRPKAYLCDDRILVMPDLAPEGFASRHFRETLSLNDVLLVTAALARFHAAYANFATRKTVDPLKPYNILDEYGDIITEPTFCDCLFLRAAAKLSANIINTFSSKHKNTIPDLETKLVKLYVEASASLRHEKETFNAIIHKDLWINNIMFAPGRVVLLDYQCVRYGPPAFDLLIFLNLCTTREFRDKHEQEVLRRYYTTFCESLDAATEKRLKGLGYDEQEFLRWCDKSRMMGLLVAIAIFPYVLMDPKSAQTTFDDPETFEKLCDEDRSEPVIEYAKRERHYRERQVQSTEEFVQRYLLKEVK